MNRITKWIVIRKINKLTKNIKEDKMRRGIYTSEFLVTLISGIVVAVCNAFQIDVEIRDAIVKLAIAYIASRTAVKAVNGIKNGKN